jgi:LysM repeat protein
MPPFQLLNDVTRQLRMEKIEATLGTLRGLISQQPVIRIIVDGTPGYGHQASSVFILRRLCAEPQGPWSGFGFRGIAEVYYPELDEKDPTLPKLLALLPELEGKTTGKLVQATIQLKDYFEDGPKVWVNWAFSGGYDLVKEDTTKEYKSYNVLITQPFKYSIKPIFDTVPSVLPGNIFRSWNPITQTKKKLNLDTANSTKSFLVGQRAYKLFIAELSADDWKYYKSEKFPVLTRRLCAAVETLTSEETLATVGPTLVYGVNYPAESVFQEPVNERFVLQLAAVRKALEAVQLKPPVVMNFGDFNPGLDAALSFDTTQGLLLGAQTPAEAQTIATGELPEATLVQRTARMAAMNVGQARSTWLRFAVGLDTEYRLIDYRVDGELETLLAWLKAEPKRVLFLQMGFVPPPVFNYLMTKMMLPALFEGNNTANVAISTPVPYLNTNRPSQVGNLVRYPVGAIGEINLSEPVTTLQAIADRIQTSLSDWPTSVITKPPAQVLTDFMVQIQDDKDQYRQYFEAISSYYQREESDKFNLAAVLSFPHKAVVDGVVSELAFEAPPLEVLFARLTELIAATGKVDLLADVFTSGGIFDFYTQLSRPFGGKVVINPAAVRPVREGETLVSVVLTGPTRTFGQQTDSEFVFTAETGTIESDARFEFTLPWNLDDVPWIVFEKPFARVLASDEAYPPSSSIGGRVKGTDIDLSMNFPVEEGRIIIRGEFETAKSLSDFFAIVGGVDLASFLPAPILALAGIGVKYLELAFDTVTKTIDYISVRLETTTPWNFFDRLLLEDIVVTITVIRPIDLRTRRVTAGIVGILRIGTTSEAPRLEVGADIPKLRLRGQLLDPTLPLNDVLSIFWPGASPAWPDGKEPAITQFSIFYALTDNDYALSLMLDLRWPIVIAGTTVMTIETVGMMIAHAAASTSGTLSGSLLFLPDSARIGLTLAAAYLGNNRGWRFELKQTSGVFAISDVLKQYLNWDTTLDIAIDGVGVVVETQTNSFELTAKTARPWQIPIDTGVAITGKMRVGYNGGTAALGPSLIRRGRAVVPAIAESRDEAVIRAGLIPAKKIGWFGELNAEIKWRGIELTIFYNFDPTYKSYGIIWGFLTGKIEQKLVDGTLHDIATLQFTESASLGAMIETMISWATGSKFGLASPWSALNSVVLSGLSLSYDFTAGTVAFNIAIGPIELGFARIDSISVKYDSSPLPGDNKVMVTINGSFRWQSDPSKPLGWDATKPEQTPAPPGNGNKYLDLRLLALGQHVTIEGLRTAPTVQKAIERMAQMKDPEPGKIPDVTFDAESSWLVGTDFGVLRIDPATTPAAGALMVHPNTLPMAAAAPAQYVLTMQVVFNDPYLYGLRLALAGDAAKVFKGLDFQIMYRQVSETVGVYQAEITLPDIMRHLSVGAYSITLPVFGIAVYTNGDFQVDVGFPWNQNFSRSFSIEAIIPPGIPVMGSAGFYFGKLSSASTDRVPRAINGTFNPVLVFGFGMQIGFGKSIEYGILKAGFSLTAVGIIEGVLGKFNPYLTDGSSGSDTQIQGAYYFWLQGTFGIMGRLYGSVDFAIIKADVNVTIRLLLQLTYESFVSMTMSVIVSVDVSVSIKIDLGLFSISINFSFSMRLKETFTIENRGAPPWITGGGAAGFTASGTDLRIREHRRPAMALVAALGNPDRWQRLLASPAGTKPLGAYVAPALTVAHDERDTTNDFSKQVACYVLMPFIDTVSAADGTLHEVLTESRAAANAADTSFEKLAKMVLRWIIAAGQENDLTPEQVDALVVTEVDLAFIRDWILVSTDANPVPIPPAEIDTFLTRQFRMTMSVPPSDQAGSASTTYFPMPAALRFNVAAYGPDYSGCDYTFAAYNEISDSALGKLREYFDELAVQVQSEVAPDPALARFAAATTLSMGTWVTSDYFLLIARQMVQAALDALRDYKYVLVGESSDTVIANVNSAGQLTGDDAYDLAKLFAANPAHLLKGSRALTIGVTAPVTAADSFDRVSVSFSSAVTPVGLASANAAATQLLATGAMIEYRDQTYSVAPNDSLIAVAKHFQVKLNELLSGAPQLMSQTALFTNNASIFIPLVTYQAQSADTFTSIAALSAYGTAFNASALATQNAGRAILRTGEKVAYPGKDPYTIQANDTLADVAAAFAVSLADLFTNSQVLSQPRILMDVAVVVLPVFVYTTAGRQTLRDVANRFAAPFEILGLQAANGAVADLFDTVTADGSTDPFLDIPHLSQYRVSDLIEEAQRALAIRQLSRMVARYYMHGLRLPTTGITPKAKGIWVDGTDPNFTLPPQAGMYALTGQQFIVPALAAATGDFTFKLTRSGGPAWLLFGSGTDDLSIAIKPGSTDAARVDAVRAAALKAPLAIPLDSLGADPMSKSDLATYPLTSMIPWQTPAAITLPYGRPPSPDRVPSMRIWTLPDALVNLPDSTTSDKILPRFDVTLATYDEASGATKTTLVASYGWASVIQFTIKKVPVLLSSPATATTYEVIGASDVDVVILERIVDQTGGSDAPFRSIILGYAPEASGPETKGVQTDVVSTVTMGIAQVNLSTETRPPTGNFARDAMFEPASPLGLLNKPSAFLRLLWEASITRAGGFYLYYFNGGGGSGLPDRIFNDRDEATLSLIVVYTAATTPAQANRLTDYMTAVVTGDAIDTSRSVVVAAASPMEAPVSATATLSLAQIAEQTYSDVGDLAAANHGALLRTGARISVTEGVFQAPFPSIPLAQIVSMFGLTDINQLNAANPRWGGLPDPLVYPSAIDLPEMNLIAGTSVHTVSLEDVAGYYGENLTALAAHNAEVPGIFATGQQIIVTGGPRIRTATVPPGVEAVGATRPVPAAVPALPTDPNYGPVFLLNGFSLLNYQVAKNVYFRGSNMGLPAGPAVPDNGEPAQHDKIQVPAALVEGDTWEYRQAFPYPRFAIAPLQTMAALPPASGNPYLGLGSILQVNFQWQDYFGNTIVTTLTTPSSTDRRNQPPMLTGYTDPLLSLSQWPSVSSAWDVGAGPLIELDLTFDASRYEGLIAASAGSSTAISAQFTNDLDRASASAIANYSLSGGIAIQSASLGDDNRTVTLTTSTPMANDAYVLAASNILGVKVGDAPQRSYSGTAAFRHPDDPSFGASSVRDNATKDLRVYTQLYYQLTDANGIAFSIQSSVLAAGKSDLAPAQVTALLGWLFNSASSIFAFIQDRSEGHTTVLPPARPQTLSVPAGTVNPSQLFELTTSFEIRRTGGAVLGDLETAPGVRSAVTKIAPCTDDLEQSTTLGLTTFATNFENFLSSATQKMKVAGGVDRVQLSTVRNGATLWSVRVGTSGTSQPIAYSIENKSNPDIFAPQPISNQLQSRQGVSIFDYNTGSGISPTVSRTLDFTDIDMDVWGGMLFSSIDDALTPEFTAPIQIVGARKSPASPIDYLQQILDEKKKFATAASLWMIPVFQDSQADPKNVREAFYQQLLSRLSNAYATRAAVQFTATVSADIEEPIANQLPRLFGNIIDHVAEGEPRSEITLTSPKLALASGTGVPLPFLLLASPNVTEDGAVVPSIDLDLTYDGTHIEHQIGELEGIDGYVASSWLSFIVVTEQRPLTQPLGQFTVPMILRAFPTAPSMVAQNGAQTSPLSVAPLSDVLQWTYTFDYSLPFHYPQDRVYCTVDFNIGELAMAAAFIDAFPAIAEFITVFPDVQKDLVAILATIDATTTDSTVIANAAIAVESFIDLMQRITGTLVTGALRVSKELPTLGGSVAESYSFHIEESSLQRPDPKDPSRTVNVLLVTIVGAPPEGVGTPVVRIEKYTAMPLTGPGCDGTTRFCYYYFDTTANEYLLYADGESTPGRQVVLPAMDILQRQDAWSTTFIKRNEELIPGKLSAAPFVYQTADVQFANSLHPTIDSDRLIDIASIPSGSPQTRSLSDHLTALFAALFANFPSSAENDTVILQVETTYAYRLVAGVERVDLPVFMQAPLPIVIPPHMPADGAIALQTMIANWTAGIETWFSSYRPNALDGLLRFDLAIMSNLTREQMPLLRLRDLELALQFIQPPLPS